MYCKIILVAVSFDCVANVKHEVRSVPLEHRAADCDGARAGLCACSCGFRAASSLRRHNFGHRHPNSLRHQRGKIYFSPISLK